MSTQMEYLERDFSKSKALIWLVLALLRHSQM